MSSKVVKKMFIYKDLATSFRGLLVTMVCVSMIGTAETSNAQGQPDSSYFDALSSMPNVVHAKSYRTQASIDSDRNTSGSNFVQSAILYDRSMNGARFLFPANRANPASALKPEYDGAGIVDSGNLFFTWESRWDPRWANENNRQGMRTHKTFQLGILASRSDQRRIEIRTGYSSSLNEIGRIDFRRYQWEAPGNQQPLPNQVGNFVIAPDTWTRYFAFVDFDARQLSVWVADATRAPVQLLDRFQFTTMDPGGILTSGLDSFWFQYNSSQSRIGPELYTWARNLVVLRDVSNASQLVQQGASVANDGVFIAPNPPVWNQ